MRNPQPSEPTTLRPKDLLLYLVGDRAAIERIAAARHAWIVGAILVLSAGIARNYDHLDLLRNPEWFIGPFAASMVSILFIFLWILWPLRLHKVGRKGRQLGTFLTLAWMTAPCAWLYGIPVESFTDIVTATKWNIAFLAVVALWRVAIIVRAVSVLAEVRWQRVLPLVLAPAALEAMVGSTFQSLSLVGIMGGVRLPPHTELLVEASQFVAVASFWTAIAAFILSFVIRGRAKRPLTRSGGAFPKPACTAAAMALLAWAVPAAALHAPAANRHRLNALIDQQRYAEAAAFASSRQREDFGRIHHLPPSPDETHYYGAFPLELLLALSEDAPSWLRDEWSAGAFESIVRSPVAFDRDLWEELRVSHPGLADQVTAHAEHLRAEASPDSDEAFWLRRFDEAVRPADDPR